MTSQSDGRSPETAYPLGILSRKLAIAVEKWPTRWVTGQLVQITQRPNGWVYMTLRDPQEEASVNVTCSVNTFDLAGPLPQGSMVTAQVKVRFWTKNGQLNLNALQIRATGEGMLLAQLEQRKRLLQAEGLFDPARKKPLPFLPRAIGLITGAHTAAEADVLRQINNRWPQALVIAEHTLVQGQEAALQVITALHALDIRPEVEVIIIARGGGSLEDLLPFSDEGLLRAVAACRTPIVSAIGHETDHPLLDLVADLRVSTPTAAAKVVVPDAQEEQSTINDQLLRVRSSIISIINHEQRCIDQLRSRPVMQNPAATIDGHLERLAATRERADRAVEVFLSQEGREIAHLISRGQALSPRSTLERGYAIISSTDDVSISSVHDVAPGQAVKALLSDGVLQLQVADEKPKRRTRAPRSSTAAQPKPVTD